MLMFFPSIPRWKDKKLLLYTKEYGIEEMQIKESTK